MNVELNGTRIFYTRHGRGLPLLTMHGPGFDHTMLRPWLDPLADSGELIYYDHRGTGRSRREEMSAVTDSTWTEDAEALRQALGLWDVIVFGHSYGGCLAQKYALTYPEHVRGLILCATMPVFDFTDVMMANARARGTPEQFETLVSAFSQPLEDDGDFRAKWTKAMPIYFHRYDAEIGAMLSRNILFSAKAMNQVLFTGLPGLNTLSRLGTIEAPTLVLGGRSDWMAPPEHAAARLHEAIKGSSLTIFESSGHFPFVEEQPLFLSIVRDWLSGLRH